MWAINKTVCDSLIQKGKWKPIMCSLCVREKRRSDCENWTKEAINIQEDEFGAGKDDIRDLIPAARGQRGGDN